MTPRLNAQQEKAFLIIGRHIVRTFGSRVGTGNATGPPPPEQVLSYRGGPGGTGKSQVLKALRLLFRLLKREDAFTAVAYTGAAAVLIDGSTIHSLASLRKFANGQSKDTDTFTVQLHKLQPSRRRRTGHARALGRFRRVGVHQGGPRRAASLLVHEHGVRIEITRRRAGPARFGWTGRGSRTPPLRSSEGSGLAASGRAAFRSSLSLATRMLICICQPATMALVCSYIRTTDVRWRDAGRAQQFTRFWSLRRKAVQK